MPANDFAKLLAQLNTDLQGFKQCVQAIQEYRPSQDSIEWLHQAQNLAKLMQADANKAQVMDYFQSSKRLLRRLDQLIHLRLDATNCKLLSLVLTRLANQLNEIFSQMSWRVPLQPKLFLIATLQPLTLDAVTQILEQPNRMLLNLLNELNQLRQCCDAQGRPLPFNGMVDLQGRRNVLERFTDRLLILLRRVHFQEATLQKLENSVWGRLPNLMLSVMGKLKFSSATLLLTLRQFQAAHDLFKQLINSILAATGGVEKRYLSASVINEANEQFLSLLLDETLHQFELFWRHQHSPALLRSNLLVWDDLQQTHQAKNPSKIERINRMQTQIGLWIANELQAIPKPRKLWQFVRDISGVMSQKFEGVTDVSTLQLMAAAAFDLTLNKDLQLANRLGPLPLPQFKLQSQPVDESQQAFMVQYGVLASALQYWILQYWISQYALPKYQRVSSTSNQTNFWPPRLSVNLIEEESQQVLIAPSA